MPQARIKKKRITRAAAKAKGRRAVDEVIDLIYKRFFHIIDKEDVMRPAGSQPGEDVWLSPEARKYFPFSVEVKWHENLNIWAALKQAEKNAGDHIPLVFFRRSHTKMYVTLPAEDFLRIIK